VPKSLFWQKNVFYSVILAQVSKVFPKFAADLAHNIKKRL